MERHSQAVQIDTTVGDAWPDPDEDDTLWSQGSPAFATWLRQAFLHIHQGDRVMREVIHQHGLLYTWQGSAPSLEPLLLLAHQDVVLWRLRRATHGRGHNDIERQTIWGRSAVDCKQFVIGIMSSVDTLIASGFQPKSTVLLSFGFDEESGGNQGAAHISKVILNRYGKYGVAFIGTDIPSNDAVDEGTPILPADDPSSYGQPLATVAVTEKGSLNVHMAISSRGGHSSRIIATLEDHPFPDVLGDASHASLQHLQCLRDAPHMPKHLRRALQELERAEKGLDATWVSTGGRHASLPRLRRWYEKFCRADDGLDVCPRRPH